MDGEISVFQNVARPTRFPLEFQCETGLLLGCNEKINPFSDKAGELTLMLRSGGEKGLRLSCARSLGVPLEGKFLDGRSYG